jgi:hypothetical protein
MGSSIAANPTAACRVGSERAGDGSVYRVSPPWVECRLASKPDRELLKESRWVLLSNLAHHTA